jgi:membrane transport protein XK
MRQELLELATKAGENTWRQGLLKKGTGICHGISGNGYVLHNLFRTFKGLA